MKSVVAGIGGALLATLAVAAFQTRMAAPAAPAELTPAAASVYASDAAPAIPPVSIACEPGQQAVVRQTLSDGELTTAAECTGSSLEARPARDLVEMSPAPARAVPVAYEPAPAPAPAPRVVRVREAERRRDWKKTALVIGGSAGAGAGIGALAGGKKGALIGAAIGGGAATIYEVAKKK